MSSNRNSRLNIIGDDENQFHSVLAAGNATRAPRVVTPERTRHSFRYVPIYSEHFENEGHQVYAIGIFDSEILACHETIRWLISSDKGIDTESDAWDNDYSPEEAIELLCMWVTNFSQLQEICRRYGKLYFNHENGWYLNFQRF